MKKKKKAQKADQKPEPGIKNVVTNRRARFEYHIFEKMEAGIALQGTEVKSLRNGSCSLQESYASIQGGELWLHDMHIAPYEMGTHWNHEPKRPRKLLMHKKEIKRLFVRLAERGFTLIPLRVYFKFGKAKVELGLAKGKKFYDKREDLRKKDEAREAEAAARKYRD
jgi:SsrA-binding protein